MPNHPQGLILVFDGDSDIRAVILDVLKKAVGREECSLCAITYGPLGKRGAWKECEARLGLTVSELHRDQLPPEWGIPRAALPCVLAQADHGVPLVLVGRAEIAACRGDVAALEQRIRASLAVFAA